MKRQSKPIDLTTAQLALRIMDYMTAVHEIGRTVENLNNSFGKFAESLGKQTYELANKIQTIEMRLNEVESVVAKRELNRGEIC